MKKEQMKRKMLQEHELLKFTGGIRLDPKKILYWLLDQLNPEYPIRT